MITHPARIDGMQSLITYLTFLGVRPVNYAKVATALKSDPALAHWEHGKDGSKKPYWTPELLDDMCRAMTGYDLDLVIIQNHRDERRARGRPAKSNQRASRLKPKKVEPPPTAAPTYTDGKGRTWGRWIPLEEGHAGLPGVVVAYAMRGGVLSAQPGGEWESQDPECAARVDAWYQAHPDAVFRVWVDLQVTVDEAMLEAPEV